MASGKGYIFISYNTSDRNIADRVRLHLIDRQCPCWMAPYDIPAGSRYAHVLNDALENCSALLLLLSNAAQESPFVEREVDRAVACGKPIIAVRLEELALNSGFKFYIGNRQIIDAFDLGTNPDALRNLSDALWPMVSHSQLSEKPPVTGEGETAESAVLAKNAEQNKWLSPYEDLIEEGENEFLCGRIEKAREIFQRLTELDEPIGYIKLAESYRGELSRKEWTEVTYQYKLAWMKCGFKIKEGQTRYYYWLAKACLYGPEMSKAYDRMLMGAQAGDPKAQFGIYLYFLGTDNSTRIHWLRKAAEQNQTDAMAHLASGYRVGFEMEKDPAVAEYWYKKRFEILLARYNEKRTVKRIMDLARAYKSGAGCQENIERSKSLYKEASAMGSPGADFELGVICREQGDYVQAVNYLTGPAEDLARIDNSDCQTARALLGKIYEEGPPGVKRDLSLAKKYYLMISKSGSGRYHLPGEWPKEHMASEDLERLQSMSE